MGCTELFPCQGTEKFKNELTKQGVFKMWPRLLAYLYALISLQTVCLTICLSLQNVCLTICLCIWLLTICLHFLSNFQVVAWTNRNMFHVAERYIWFSIKNMTVYWLCLYVNQFVYFNKYRMFCSSCFIYICN